MSEQGANPSAHGGETPAGQAVSGELLPVPAPEARPVERPEAALAAPVAAATGGLLAGFMTIALVRVLRGARRSRGAVRLGGRRGKGLEIAGSRSFLVDVHVLKR
jgi:hypothetical protein